MLTCILATFPGNVKRNLSATTQKQVPPGIGIKPVDLGLPRLLLLGVRGLVRCIPPVATVIVGVILPVGQELIPPVGMDTAAGAAVRRLYSTFVRSARGAAEQIDSGMDLLLGAPATRRLTGGCAGLHCHNADSKAGRAGGL